MGHEKKAREIFLSERRERKEEKVREEREGEREKERRENICIEGDE